MVEVGHRNGEVVATGVERRDYPVGRSDTRVGSPSEEVAVAAGAVVGEGVEVLEEGSVLNTSVPDYLRQADTGCNRCSIDLEVHRV